MKFVLRSGLNAGASLVVSLFTLYMLSFLTSIIIYTNIYDSVFEVIAQFVILAFQFSPFLEFGKLDLPLVGTGGTITSLALIAQNLSAYDEAKIHGYLLTKEKLEKMSLAILENPSALLSPLPEKRRDILPQGLEILLNMMAILEKTSLFVSTRDGLYGLQSEGLSVR